MKPPKSLEQLLYELVSWVLFYPITMSRSVVHGREGADGCYQGGLHAGHLRWGCG